MRDLSADKSAGDADDASNDIVDVVGIEYLFCFFLRHSRVRLVHVVLSLLSVAERLDCALHGCGAVKKKKTKVFLSFFSLSQGETKKKVIFFSPFRPLYHHWYRVYRFTKNTETKIIRFIRFPPIQPPIYPSVAAVAVERTVLRPSPAAEPQLLLRVEGQAGDRVALPLLRQRLPFSEKIVLGRARRRRAMLHRRRRSSRTSGSSSSFLSILVVGRGILLLLLFLGRKYEV